MSNGDDSERPESFALKGSPRPRVCGQIVRQIGEIIHTGKLTPADRLLPERQLSETLGVSRTAVREALAKLASLGRIEVKPDGGAFVKEVTFTLSKLLIPA